MLFNIAYTPYKTKSNATEQEVKKQQHDRAFYDMSGDKNFYKYVTTEGKQVPEKSVKFTMKDYFEKTAGVFNENGMLSKEQVKEMQLRAQQNKGNIWHGFISLDEDNSHKIEQIESCIALVKHAFGDFFKDNGFDRDNLDLMCGLHLDHPEHLHIHFAFWEKEPKVKNKRAAGYKFRAKGRIPMENINRMVERVNYYVFNEDFKEIRHNVISAIKDRDTYSKLWKEDFIAYEVKHLAKEIPEGRFGYAHKEMKPYREKIDSLVDDLINSSKPLREAHDAFMDELAKKEETLKDIMGKHYKEQEKYEMDLIEKAPNMSNNFFLSNVHTIERLKFDYRRRLGNVVLKQVRYIQENKYKRNPKRKYALNDRNLKRRKAISTRIVRQGITSFLSTFASIFADDIKDHRNRLREIEEEIKMQREKEEQEAQEAQNYKPTPSKWNWSK